MPVSLNPSQNPLIVPDVSSEGAGVMTPELLEQLETLVAGGPSFVELINKPQSELPNPDTQLPGTLFRNSTNENIYATDGTNAYEVVVDAASAKLPAGSTTVTYYCSDAGVDAPWRGSFSEPFRTLQYALKLLPPDALGREYVFDISAIALITLTESIFIPNMIGANFLAFASGDPFYPSQFQIQCDINIISRPTSAALVVANGDFTAALDPVTQLATFTVPGASWTVNQWQNYLGFDDEGFGFTVISSGTDTIVATTGDITAFDSKLTLFLPATEIDGSAVPGGFGAFSNFAERMSSSISFTGIKFTSSPNINADINFGDVGKVGISGCMLNGIQLFSTFGIIMYGNIWGQGNPNGEQFYGLSNQFGGSIYYNSSILNCHDFAWFGDADGVGLISLYMTGTPGGIGRAGDPAAYAPYSLLNSWIVGSGADAPVVAQSTIFNLIQDIRIDAAGASAGILVENGARFQARGKFAITADVGIQTLDGGTFSIVEGTVAADLVITSTIGDIAVGTLPARSVADFFNNAPIEIQSDVLGDASIVRVDGATAQMLLFKEVLYQGAVVAGTFVKTGTVAGTVTQLLTTDSPNLKVGIALDAGTSVTGRVVFIRGQQVTMKLDSAANAVVGTLAYYSATVAGALSATANANIAGVFQTAGTAGTTAAILS